MNADAYIIDLEDSIEESQKHEALYNLVQRLNMLVQLNKKFIVRLNKKKYVEELKVLENYPLDFMLPKFEKTEEYKEVEKYSDVHKFYALLETAKAFVNLKEIASCPFLYALAFGAEDYTASVGMKNDIKYLIYQKSKIVTYAKAYGKFVYDTPSFQLYDQDKFKAEVENAVNLGFDGKLSISPKHISYIKNAFLGEDLESIKRIVSQYEKEQKAVL